MLCGWLSPKGDFYPCGQYEHIHLAKELTGIHYPDIQTKQHATLIQDDYLLEEKWIKLFYDGLAVGNFLNHSIFQPGSQLITDEQIRWIMHQHHNLSAKQERCLGMYLELEASR